MIVLNIAKMVDSDGFMRYIRSRKKVNRMIENKMDNSMELNEEQLEAVTGGRLKKIIPPCSGPWAHKFVKTGKHIEEDVLPFGIGGWTNGRDEDVCSICGTKVWSHDAP